MPLQLYDAQTKPVEMPFGLLQKSHRHFKINNLQRCCLVLNISSGGDNCLVLGKGCPPFIHFKIRTESKCIANKSKSVVESSYSPFSCAIATILIVACLQM